MKERRRFYNDDNSSSTGPIDSVPATEMHPASSTFEWCAVRRDWSASSAIVSQKHYIVKVYRSKRTSRSAVRSYGTNVRSRATSSYPVAFRFSALSVAPVALTVPFYATYASSNRILFVVSTSAVLRIFFFCHPSAVWAGIHSKTMTITSGVERIHCQSSRHPFKNTCKCLHKCKPSWKVCVGLDD